MKRQTLDYLAIGIFIVLVIGSILIVFGISRFAPQKTAENKLAEYRSEDIPEDCRIPEYEDDVEEWKKNLRHNMETWHCLEYFE